MSLTWQDVPQAVDDAVQKYAAVVVLRHAYAPGELIVLEDAELGEINVKVATALEPAAKAFDWPGKMLGGPTPLTRTLTGSALGALLGYGSGWMAERLLPEKYVERGKASRNFGLLGGLLGGAGSAYLFGRPAVAQHGWGGFLKKADLDPDDVQTAMKYAAASSAFLPNIPVDAWNRTVWARPELPASTQAMATGLVSAASAAHGGAKLVSPFDVGRIVVGMGAGAASGMIVGRTLGALAGLTPAAQDAIFKTGVGAGLLTRVVPMAFSH